MTAQVVNIQFDNRAICHSKIYVETTQKDDVLTITLHDNLDFKTLHPARQDRCQLLWSRDRAQHIVNNIITVVVEDKVREGRCK